MGFNSLNINGLDYEFVGSQLKISKDFQQLSSVPLNPSVIMSNDGSSCRVMNSFVFITGGTRDPLAVHIYDLRSFTLHQGPSLPKSWKGGKH